MNKENEQADTSRLANINALVKITEVLLLYQGHTGTHNSGALFGTLPTAALTFQAFI